MECLALHFALALQALDESAVLPSDLNRITIDLLACRYLSAQGCVYLAFSRACSIWQPEPTTLLCNTSAAHVGCSFSAGDVAGEGWGPRQPLLVVACLTA